MQPDFAGRISFKFVVSTGFFVTVLRAAFCGVTVLLDITFYFSQRPQPLDNLCVKKVTDREHHSHFVLKNETYPQNSNTHKIAIALGQ